MEIWVTERQTPDLSLSMKISSILFHKVSEYQDILVVDTPQCGKVLLLDNKIQTTETDEFIYHEMITHVALNSHPAPSRILVIGGGDGGTVREVLKHPSVETVELVEIDSDVIEVARQYLTSISSGLSNHKCKLIFADGTKYIENAKNYYDVVIVDSTDPVGQATNLFTEDFHKAAYASLKEDGIFVSQTESPILHKDLICRVHKSLSNTFPIVGVYTAPMPTYPSGLWSFMIGSKHYDPSTPVRRENSKTKYYSEEIHKASFVLPRFFDEAISGDKPLQQK